MRLTRAQRFAALAVLAPVAIFIGIAFFLPRTPDEVSAADHLAVFAVFSSFLGFLTLALFAARPKNRWFWHSRSVLLGLIGAILGITGCILVGAAFTRSVDWLLIYALWFPGGIAVIRAMFKESLDDSGFAKELPRLTPLRLMADQAAPLVVVVAVLIAIGLVLRALDVNATAFGMAVYPIGLAIPAGWILAAMATSVLNRGSSQAGVPKTVLASAQWMRGHRWRPVAADEAGRAWAATGPLARGGSLEAGWRCNDCSIVRLHGRDGDGTPYDLYLNPPKVPWGEWLAGPFLARVTHTPGGPSRLRVGIFQRFDCRWVPMPDDELASRLAELAGSRRPAAGWVCADCGAERIDLADATGADLLLIKNPATWELTWVLGFFFVLARTPALASDAPSTTAPATEPA